MDDAEHERADGLRELVRGGLMQFAPPLWMVFVLTVIGVEVYTRFEYVSRLPSDAFPSRSWATVAQLGSTASYALAGACVIALAGAALIGGRTARLTYWLSALGSAWVVFAGACLMAAAAHGTPAIEVPLGLTGRASAGILGIADAGAGLVVLLVSIRLLGSSRPSAAAVTEPVVVEIS